jgi:hypothetical protein
MLNKVGLAVFLFISAMVLVTPAVAQRTVWQIDSEHSTARLFLASSKNPDDGDNVGVARTSGLIEQAGDPTGSDFDFTICPADKTIDQSGNNSDYTVITFTSTHVVPVNEKTFRVTGQLTLSYLERSATSAPSEDYSGAVYGAAVHRSVTREAVFEFQQGSAAGIQKAKGNTAEWLGSSTTIGEDFPQLLNVVSSTNWPTFVADEKCTTPSSVGEDYSGATCTGETIQRSARADDQCAVPSVGEDFMGEMCAKSSAVQVANEVQIKLDLHLNTTALAMVAISGQ